MAQSLQFAVHGRDFDCQWQGTMVELTINGEAIPDDSVHHLLRYGIKQLLQDSIAGKLDVEAERALERKFQRLVAGTLATREAAIADPVTALAFDMALNRVKEALRESGVVQTKYTFGDNEAGGKSLRAAAHANKAKFMDAARAEVERLRKIDIEVDF